MAQLCVIPARAGSKGLKDKNIRNFRGRPLLAHSVRHACEAGVFDEVAVSSDSEAYLAIAADAGASLLIRRPPALASDTAGSIDVLLHALQTAEVERGCTYNVVCLLQPTSPVREPQDIKTAIAMLDGDGLDCVVSVSPSKASPYFNLLERDPKTGRVSLSKTLPADVSRRQDAPEVFLLNGSIYVWTRAALTCRRTIYCDRTGLYPMPALRSVDIDTEEDWELAEMAHDLLTRPGAADPAA